MRSAGVGSSSPYVRAYRNLPLYNGSGVFRAKLSRYKPISGNTQAASELPEI